VIIGLAASQHGGHLWGAVLCVVAAIAYAAGVTAQKPALRDNTALGVTWAACTIGALSLSPYAPQLVHELHHVRAPVVAWTVFLGLGPTATGFVFWAYALARTDASKLGVTTYLVPPLAALIGWIALGEVPPLLALPGGLLCLVGVGLTRRKARAAGAG
jgi:drug/metabolite transporter (DMT)-like permease